MANYYTDHPAQCGHNRKYRQTITTRSHRSNYTAFACGTIPTSSQSVQILNIQMWMSRIQTERLNHIGFACKTQWSYFDSYLSVCDSARQLASNVILSQKKKLNITHSINSFPLTLASTDSLKHTTQLHELLWHFCFQNRPVRWKKCNYFCGRIFYFKNGITFKPHSMYSCRSHLYSFLLELVVDRHYIELK